VLDSDGFMPHNFGMSEPREHFSEHTAPAPAWLSVRTAARLLDVSEQTVRRWIRDGVLESARFGANGATIRIRAEAVYQRQKASAVAV
jgi:excisionase family DNA binding protein